MDRVLAERAQHMFLLADKERKGFIVKKDMQHMRAEVALSADQLEAVFDSLDVQGNTYLTMQQFLAGFGEYLAVHAGLQITGDSSHTGNDMVYSSDIDQEPPPSISPGSIRKLDGVLHRLADFGSFGGGLHQLCRMVELEGNSKLLDALVTFLQQLLRELTKQRAELQLLEQACLNKEELHRTEERERSAEVRTRQSQELELQQHEKQLQQLHHGHQQLTMCVRELQSAVLAACQQNNHLATTKVELERNLQRSEERTSQLQRQLQTLRSDVIQDRRHYMSSGFQLARTILTEQQGLTRHLQLLQSISATLEGSPGERCSYDQENDSATQSCVHCTYGSLHFTQLQSDEHFQMVKDDLQPCLLEELQSCD